MKRIIILGGGFGGVFTALRLERLLPADSGVEVLLVSQENFLLFTPMLHEVASSELDPSAIVNPIHRLLKRTRFFCGTVDAISPETKTVVLSHGLDGSHAHEISYDHLVVALGSVTHFYDLPGLEEYSLPMKSLGDALHLRNRLIACLEEADFECAAGCRKELLTFVVAGGGFAGVETVAAISDFLHHLRRHYPRVEPDDIRVVLVSSGKVILPELDARLGAYAGKLLQQRGVEIRFEEKVTGYESKRVRLSGGDVIAAETLVWTAGTAPHPLLAALPCEKVRGRILVNESLRSPDDDSLWALGDCAMIPTGETGVFHPPTAQHAIREAKTLAKNLVAALRGEPLVPFRFRTLGQLASLGRRRGVAQILGFRFEGFLAWWLWRTIYLLKLPRLEKRIRVALDWTLDIFFHGDIVQLPTGRTAQSRPSSALDKLKRSTG